MSAYIVFASWEDRFIEGVKNDINLDIEISDIYCFYFEDEKFSQRTRDKISELEAITSNKNLNLKKIALKFEDYIISWREVKEAFKEISLNQMTTLNISTMPRNMIFCMMHFLENSNYNVIYYPAEKHADKPTTNPSTPHIVLQHGGIMHPSKKTFLVVFIGHDRKRVQQLYNYFEPSKTLIIRVCNNFTPTPDNYNDKYEGFMNVSDETISNPSHNTSFDKLNQRLLQKKDTLQKYNVLLCSLGSKIESIGIYKFHKKYPETALLYAPSKDYADDYSTGIMLNEKKTVSSNWILNNE